MTHSKVNGSRTLRKGSKKGSKHGSKRSKPVDFSSILNDMNDMPMQPQEQMMPGMGMPGMPGMQPNMMPMMPQTGMEQMGMAQMAMPQMGMPQMMMGADPKNVDPLHLQSFVPQNQNINLNNYGVDANKLISGTQMSQEFGGKDAPQVGGGYFGRAMENFYARF